MERQRAGRGGDQPGVGLARSGRRRARAYGAANVFPGAREWRADRDSRDRSLEPGSSFIRIPGTKTAGAKRAIPVAPALAEVLQEISDKTGKVAEPWGNGRRDLAAACKRAGIDQYSPNELRRAFGSWLRQAGVSKEIIAALFGHTGTDLIDSTYAFFADEQFVEAVGRIKVPGLLKKPR